MLSIGGRIELNSWIGFSIAGGLNYYYSDPDFELPTLKITSACMKHEGNDDPLNYARIVRLSDDEDGKAKEDAFQANISRIIHGEDSKWKLLGFRVFPDGIELQYGHEDGDYHFAEIHEHEFGMTIDVPVSDEEGCQFETFSINVGRCFSGEYHSTIRRSGEQNQHYELWYSESHTITHPAPKNRFARLLAKMLFPDYYSKKPSCIDYQYPFGQKKPFWKFTRIYRLPLKS